MHTTEIAVQADGLHRHFEMGNETIRALDGVTINVGQGEFFGIAGPSGSGKSTLLYLIGGMDRPTAGSIKVLGQEITKLDENQLADYRNRQLGFIFQSFHLIPNMTALQNVEIPLLLNRVPLRERRQRAAALLEQVGLKTRLHQRPDKMSGGQRQRVAIARALANHPQVLLADEPTGNLDSRSGTEVVELLKRLCQDQGMTVLIVSHDPGVIAATDRHIRIHDGRIVNGSQP
jgi:putative ABC transport system ATP-binding protein